jgi:hypothetical protein
MISNPMHSESYDESDYNPDSREMKVWREKISFLAQEVGGSFGFQNVVINVFGDWGYVDSIGTVYIQMNGCEFVHHWSETIVSRFKNEEPEALLKELLTELLEPVSFGTKQEAFRKEQVRARKESELKASLEQDARRKAEVAQKIEQYKALTPEQVKAEWAAKVAASKVAAGEEAKRAKKPILRRR